MTDLKLATQKLKTQVSIVQLISEQISLTQKGGRWLGLCPFHQEKTPSFYVFDDSYHCFGCSEHGDIIEFVKKTKGLSFIETLRYLSEKFGVELPELDESKPDFGMQNKANEYFKIFNLAQHLYTENLKSSDGQQAIEYLKQRGFNETKIKEFGFGLSLSRFDQLSDYLRKNRIQLNTACEVELLRPSKKPGGSPYDFFRERLMIPIKDRQGRIIAFGGRTLKNDPVKYVNSPNHPLFNKKNNLFGLADAKQAIMNKKRVFITEGYMDTLQMWQKGINETVAVLGTALSSEHLTLLQHITQQVYLIFDGDNAGINASLRSVDMSLKFPSLEFKVILLPDNHDPDSYLRSHTIEQFEELVRNSKPLLHFILSIQMKKLSGLAIPNYIQTNVLPWIKQISDPLQKDFLLNEVAKISGLDPSHLSKQLLNSSSNKYTITETPKPTSRNDTLSPWQFELLGHLFFASHHEVDINKIHSLIHKEMALTERWIQNFDKILSALKSMPGTLFEMTSQQLQERFSFEDSIIQIFERFRSQHKAYESKQRMLSIEKLFDAHQQKKRAKTLQDLKLELAKLQNQQPTPEHELHEILRQIGQLTSDPKP